MLDLGSSLYPMDFSSLGYSFLCFTLGNLYMPVTFAISPPTLIAPRCHYTQSILWSLLRPFLTPPSTDFMYLLILPLSGAFAAAYFGPLLE